jgi:fumarylpyruvate hydrolase
MSYVFPPIPLPSLPIEGSADRFPIRRILCVGRNYAAHAREMGQDERDPPFFFSKPADAIVMSGATIPYPPGTSDLNYEIELVVAIGKPASDIAPKESLDVVHGYAVGIDLTRRDVQIQARDKGRPWDLGKGFDNSAPCTQIRPVAKVGHPDKGRIWLAVNDAVKQDGDLDEMIWQVPDIIATLSKSIRLMPGDLIYTGTPAGVGPTVAGDVLTGGVDGVDTIKIAIAARG